MNKSLSLNLCKKLERTIRGLCPVIEQRINAKNNFPWTEFDLRKELVACILGSQVRHEMATIALELLEQAQLLDEAFWTGPCNTFESDVFSVLSGQTHTFERKWSYRFPAVRSQQIAKTRDAVVKKSLSDRLSEIADPKKLREQLVKEIAGLGPKQASMFLRNIGRCYDLAILDTHVLKFMDLKSLLCLKKAKINTVKNYETTEKIVVSYAKKLGYPVGYMDWALWITMRAARELGI